MLQKELIYKRAYAKKEILNIVNNIQQLPEPGAGLNNRNENLKKKTHHIRSEFVELKALYSHNLLI